MATGALVLYATIAGFGTRGQRARLTMEATSAFASADCSAWMAGSTTIGTAASLGAGAGASGCAGVGA